MGLGTRLGKECLGTRLAKWCATNVEFEDSDDHVSAEFSKHQAPIFNNA